MPIRYEIDPARRLVVATADAVVTEADLRDYVTSVLSDPAVRTGFRELVDLRGAARIEIPDSVIADGIPSVIKELEQQLVDTRTAVVASEDNVEEVSRLCDLLQSAVPTTVRVFVEMDEAGKWLGLAGKSQRSERRVAPRSAVQIAVLCQMEVQNHSAEIVNISLTGVLLSCPTVRPALGVPIRIHWELPDARGTSELEGMVVRHIEGGFAVRFQTTTAELLWLLGDPF